jgi:transcription initiation factor TFIIIB Brf1 subunit/transcription initiation factor TFIIB
MFQETSSVKASFKSLKDISKLKREKKQQKTKSQHNDLESCINCSKYDLVMINGQLTCRDCGLIYSKHIDSGIEWRVGSGSNNQPSDKIRTSINENKYITGITTTTTIGQNTNYKNNKNNNLIKNMNDWKQIDYKDKSMIEKINNITSICKNNDINDMMIENICDTFYKICKILNPRRKKLIALMATSVMLCFEEKGYIKTVDEVAQMFDIEEKTLIKLSKEFEIVWQEIKYDEDDKTSKLQQKSFINNNANENISNKTQLSINIIKSKIKEFEQNDILDFKNTEELNKLIEQKAHIDAVNEKHVIESNKYILNNQLNNLVYYLKKLKIPNTYFKYFKDLYTQIFNDRVLLEHIPKSKFAVIIYQGCINNNINIDINLIIKACKTSDVTFNKCYKKFKNIYLEE